METIKTMSRKNLLVLLVTVFALALSFQSVSAFGEITSVEVNGLEALGANGNPVGIDFSNFAGERVPVLVRFDAAGAANEVVAENARVVVWISGERTDAVESPRFDVLGGRTYARTVFINVPFDLDEDLDESRVLEVAVESEEEGTADEVSIDLTVQRESYLLEILAVDMQPEVQAGQSLVFDVVLKNRGRQLAEDTFLRIRVPELGLETQTYFGDLSSRDQGGSVADRDDAVERRAYLRIPADVPLGLYSVMIEAFNDDSFASLEKRVLVAGAEEDTMVITPSNSKTFSTGDTGVYKLTLVNRGSVVRVYEIELDSSAGLNVEVSDPLVVVPAGSSRTVDISANADVRDDYTFTAIVHSDGKVIGDESFTASVTEGNGRADSIGSSSAAVLLTVILAIVFVVLLVVLIVLLTRKPDKTEEFGESYY